MNPEKVETLFAFVGIEGKMRKESPDREGSSFLGWRMKPILCLLFLIFFLSLALGTGCEPMKNKTRLDRLYELDPGGKIFVSPMLREKSPRNIAILPFRSLVGGGRIEGSQGLFSFITGTKEERARSIEEGMRRSFFGQLAQLEFDLIKPSQIDRILEKEQLDSWEKIRSWPVQRLGELLGAEALVFGEVTHFDYYYALLYSQLAAGLSLEMVDTQNGNLLWKVRDARRDHTVRIAYDPIGLTVGLFQAGFALRPINMMRAMDEISRELVGTLPPPKRNL
jgi:hypothetical protein